MAPTHPALLREMQRLRGDRKTIVVADVAEKDRMIINLCWAKAGVDPGVWSEAVAGARHGRPTHGIRAAFMRALTEAGVTHRVRAQFVGHAAQDVDGEMTVEAEHYDPVRDEELIAASRLIPPISEQPLPQHVVPLAAVR